MRYRVYNGAVTSERMAWTVIGHDYPKEPTISRAGQNAEQRLCVPENKKQPVSEDTG